MAANGRAPFIPDVVLLTRTGREIDTSGPVIRALITAILPRLELTPQHVPDVISAASNAALTLDVMRDAGMTPVPVSWVIDCEQVLLQIRGFLQTAGADTELGDMIDQLLDDLPRP